MRLLCSLLAIAVVTMAAYLAWGQDTEGLDSISTESKLLELMKERRQVLHQALEFRRIRFQQGTATFEEVMQSEIALAQADLEIAPTRASRQLVHERLIKHLRQQEELAEARFGLGTVTQIAVLETKSARLQAEINMLRDRR